MNSLIDGGNDILIVSGEGERGTEEVYTGKRTLRAIKMRVRKEECEGDRWAYAKVFSHTGQHGEPVYVDVLSGEYR